MAKWLRCLPLIHGVVGLSPTWDLGDRDLIVALCTSPHNGDYLCEVILKTFQLLFLKIMEQTQKYYGQTDGRTDRWTDGGHSYNPLPALQKVINKCKRNRSLCMKTYMYWGISTNFLISHDEHWTVFFCLVPPVIFTSLLHLALGRRHHISRAFRASLYKKR